MHWTRRTGKYQQIYNRIEEWISEPVGNAESLAVVFTTLAALRRGDFDTEYLLSLYQFPVSHVLDVVDAYCFAQLHMGLLTGQIMAHHLIIDHSPFADKDIEQNNAILKQFPYPWRAEFYPEKGRGDCDDGFIAWDEPIEFGQVLYDGKEKVVNVSPCSVPLEVGHTTPEITLHHIKQDKGLARWPYGSDRIYLFVGGV